MGFMDLFSNMSEWNLQDLASGGIIGASMGAQKRKQDEEYAARPKPGRYCARTCRYDGDRCTPCMEIQGRLEQALDELEKLEEAADLSTEQVQQMVSNRKIEKCSLCGAPYTKGLRECPYCGTKYPEGSIDFDIPLSRRDREDQMLQKAEEAWNIAQEKMKLEGQYNQETVGSNWVELIQKYAGSFVTTLQDMMKQTGPEIKEAAAHYGVPMSIYIGEAVMGKMTTLQGIRLEEQNRIYAEEQRKRNEAMAQQQALQAQQQAMQPQRKRYTMMDYMQQRAETTTYNYSGGAGPSTTGSCCGTCSYYLVHEKKCLYFKGTSGEYRSGPNDYCNRYRR